LEVNKMHDYAIEPSDRWFYEQQDRLDARDAMREEYEDGIFTMLTKIGLAHGIKSRRLFEIEKQARNEAMEACLDAIGNNVQKQAQFEEALLQVWAKYRNTEDSAEHRLAKVIDHGLCCFSHRKAKEKYR
jgi:hypothetical protein